MDEMADTLNSLKEDLTAIRSDLAEIRTTMRLNLAEIKTTMQTLCTKDELRDLVAGMEQLYSLSAVERSIVHLNVRSSCHVSSDIRFQ